MDRQRPKILLAEAIALIFRNGLVTERRRSHLVQECARSIMKFSTQCIRSACIIPAPVYSNNAAHFPPMQLFFKPFSNPETALYVTYHEIAHFLSVDEPQQVDSNRFIREWGICRSEYHFCDGTLQTFISNEATQRCNEQLNDCLACWLYTQLESHLPSERHLFKRGQWAEMQQDYVISCYLAHRQP